MALKLWMPLISDTHNLGISNVLPTSSTNTVVSDGKIGSCMKLVNVIDTGLASSEWDYASKSVSMCCWVKFNLAELRAAMPSSITNSERTTPTGNLIGGNSYGGNALCWATNNLYSSGQVNNIYLFGCYRHSSSGHYYQTSSYEIQFDTWTHVALISDKVNGKYKLYINGSLYTQCDIPTSMVNTGYNFYINWDGVCGGNGPGRLIPVRINDVRVYDNCLTETEIKDIAKGMIAHYTCSEASLTTNSGNLITGLSGGGQCTITGGNTVNISGTNSDTYFYIQTSRTLTSGKLYKLSCIGNFSSASTFYNFPIGALSNTGPGLIQVKNGYCSFIFTANDTIANAGTNIIMDDTSSSAGAGTITGLRLEELDTISDSSGYSRNLTITGNINSADSVRYDKSLITTSANLYNDLGGINGSSGTEMTVSCWFYQTDRTYYQGLVGNRKQNSTLNWYLYTHTADGSLQLHGSGLNKSSIIPTLNTWHHVVAVVKSNNKYDMYLDGIKVINDYSYTWGSSAPRITVSGFASGSEPFKGRLSDVRIYATALSADDIKDLYSLGATIS